jgi:hypothetical protein
VKSLGQIVLVVGAIVLAFMLYVFWPEIRHVGRITGPQLMTAEVRLINRCGMPDTFFVVQDLKTRRSVSFPNGVARIDVMEGDYVQLQLNARYTTEITFNGVRQRASRRMQ